MKNLVGGVTGQRVEEEIGCPRYLIGATGESAVRLLKTLKNLSPCDSSSFSIAIMTF